MKGISLLIICVSVVSSSVGQGLKIKKEVVKGINKILDSIYYELGRPIESATNSEMIFELIDTTGRYIVEDVVDGESAGYCFYNKDGEKLSEYRPYEFFQQFYHDVSQVNVVVAAAIDQTSSKLKIAWLDHRGKLLKEKEFDKDGIFLRDIKVINNRLVVISHDIKHRFTIKCYDQELNTLWSKKIEEFIHYLGVKSVPSNNSIIIYTKTEIKSFNLKSGEEIWTRRMDQFHPRAKSSISINGELIFERDYLGVVTYEMALDETGKLKKAYNINFNIFDIRNGNVVFSDTIEEKEAEPVVCRSPLDLDSDHVYIKSKDKDLRYSLVR